jgi:hypothetical protein
VSWSSRSSIGTRHICGGAPVEVEAPRHPHATPSSKWGTCHPPGWYPHPDMVDTLGTWMRPVGRTRRSLGSWSEREAEQGGLRVLRRSHECGSTRCPHCAGEYFCCKHDVPTCRSTPRWRSWACTRWDEAVTSMPRMRPPHRRSEVVAVRSSPSFLSTQHRVPDESPLGPQEIRRRSVDIHQQSHLTICMSAAHAASDSDSKQVSAPWPVTRPQGGRSALTLPMSGWRARSRGS